MPLIAFLIFAAGAAGFCGFSVIVVAGVKSLIDTQGVGITVLCAVGTVFTLLPIGHLIDTQERKLKRLQEDLDFALRHGSRPWSEANIEISHHLTAPLCG